ncbi:MAG: hypothetical protein RIQ71_2195 [Verrucomicrobiota bacterium]|jgi:hypothetical protein
MRLRTDEQQWRVERSVKDWPRLNFVTATLREEMQNPRVISERWTALIKWLRRHHFPDLKSIRVLQKHPKGHGWHIHALLDRYIPARILNAGAAKCGLGRMSFDMVSGEARQRSICYVVRYVVRDMKDRWRDKTLKGVRLLTASGHLHAPKRWWLRLSDIVIEDTGTNARALLERLMVMHGLLTRMKSRGGHPPVPMLDLLTAAPDWIRDLWMRTCNKEPARYGWVY